MLKSPSDSMIVRFFEVIAFENGFTNWTSLKNFVVEKDCLYRSGHVGLIHALFNNYQKAEDYFLKHGYLITFWKDYVVCGDEYINCLDLYGNETVVVEIKDDKLE